MMLGSLWARSFSLPPLPEKQTRLINSGVIDHLYYKFDHVMVINNDMAWEVWTNHSELDAWCIDNDCYFMYDRAIYDQWMKRWFSNGIGGSDYYFVATNNKESFVHAQMVWG